MAIKDPIKYAFLLLKFRFRSEQELRKRMKVKGFSEEDVEKTVNFLKEKGYLNDKIFVEELVEKYKTKGYSLSRIKRIVRSYGIDPIILNEMDLSFDEEILDDLIEKITKGEKVLDKKTFKKLVNKLGYLGYSKSEIFDFLSKKGIKLEFSQFSD